MKKYYVYQHIREDKNEIFYIGIGTRSKQDLRCNTWRITLRDCLR